MSWRLVALKLRPNPLVMMVHRWRSLKQCREAKSQNPVFGTRWDSSRGRQLIWQIKQTGGRQKKKKKITIITQSWKVQEFGTNAQKKRVNLVKYSAFGVF